MPTSPEHLGRWALGPAPHEAEILFCFLVQLLCAIPLYPHPHSAPIYIPVAQPVSYYSRTTLIPSFLNTEEETVHSNRSRGPQTPNAPSPGSALPAQERQGGGGSGGHAARTASELRLRHVQSPGLGPVLAPPIKGAGPSPQSEKTEPLGGSRASSSLAQEHAGLRPVCETAKRK